MTNVVSLPGVSPFDEPDPALVEICEGLLDKARSGHLRALAFASVLTDDSSATGWECTAGTQPNLALALMRLQFRFAEGLS